MGHFCLTASVLHNRLHFGPKVYDVLKFAYTTVFREEYLILTIIEYSPCVCKCASKPKALHHRLLLIVLLMLTGSNLRSDVYRSV